MKKFRVNVTETSYGFTIVEADSKNEARVKAEEQRNEGNVVWASGEFKTHDIVEEA